MHLHLHSLEDPGEQKGQSTVTCYPADRSPAAVARGVHPAVVVGGTVGCIGQGVFPGVLLVFGAGELSVGVVTAVYRCGDRVAVVMDVVGDGVVESRILAVGGTVGELGSQLLVVGEMNGPGAVGRWGCELPGVGNVVAVSTMLEAPGDGWVTVTVPGVVSGVTDRSQEDLRAEFDDDPDGEAEAVLFTVMVPEEVRQVVGAGGGKSVPAVVECCHPGSWLPVRFADWSPDLVLWCP